MTCDPLLIGASFVTYMDEEERYEKDGKLDQLWDRIEHEIRKVATEFDLQIECYRSSVYAIGAGEKPDNSGRCIVCNEWVSAQNMPRIIQRLGIGAVYEGDFYCDRHLPEESEVFAKLFPFGRNFEKFPLDDSDEGFGWIR